MAAEVQGGCSSAPTPPQGDKDPVRSTYEWRPCTPPSTWADVVLFSNFSSPEYIMALRGKDTCHKPGRVQGRQCSGTCSHLGSPCHGISSPGESPSSLAQDITRTAHQQQWLQPRAPSHLQVKALRPSVMPYGNTSRQIPTVVLTCGGPQCQGLGDVPDRLDASVGDDGDAEPARVLGHLVHRRGLGTAARQHCGDRHTAQPQPAARPRPSRLAQAPSTHMLQHSERTNPWELLP
uniref:Uncharacterized protein n=1 Tax=Geospiza parvula TaxID=87175 RepID=A0A8C3N0T1_GEOPR